MKPVHGRFQDGSPDSRCLALWQDAHPDGFLDVSGFQVLLQHLACLPCPALLKCPALTVFPVGKVYQALQEYQALSVYQVLSAYRALSQFQVLTGRQDA